MLLYNTKISEKKFLNVKLLDATENLSDKKNGRGAMRWSGSYRLRWWNSTPRTFNLPEVFFHERPIWQTVLDW